MARPALGGRTTCESCPSIDVREWQRKGLLHAGQDFSWSWTRGGDAAGSVTVRVEDAAVVLSCHHCHANSNFGVIHFFWDKILGTYRMPNAGA